ncbi:MAG: ATP-binding protein [Cyanobacteria bacterium P01_G01_bin.54]
METITPQTALQELQRLHSTVPRTPNLKHLSQTLNLSPFEQNLLLLCLSVERHFDVAFYCAQAQNNPEAPYPTLGLANQLFPNAPFTALAPAPDSPLRRWQLLHIQPHTSLLHSPLKIDEAIAQYLLGNPCLPLELIHRLTPLEPTTAPLAPTHQTLLNQLHTAWAHPPFHHCAPLELCGSDPQLLTTLAANLCDRLHYPAYQLWEHHIPSDQTQLNTLLTLWERHARLNHTILILKLDNWAELTPDRQTAFRQLFQAVRTPFILISQTRLPSHVFSLLTFEVLPASLTEQRHQWQQTLSPLHPEIRDPLIAELTNQFNLSLSQIQTLGTINPNLEPDALKAELWTRCRCQARPQLEGLAQRIEAMSPFEDLILPEPQKQFLQEMMMQVHYRTQVYHDWQFASKGQRGLSMTALFAGTSGTGKTMAAETIASTLGLDLYRIDLSATVSKYIGETEKNLREIFDAAESGGVVLLFDEADAVFGKRGAVNDSRDRFANLQVSYLLQRLEAYRGLAILTTNLKEAIDPAFLRRIRFIVKFPFPDAAGREQIWRRVFPAQVPTEGLNYRKLAQLNAAGGTIRNIALNGAFRAAAAGEAVTMAHLLRAAESEYLKLEQTLPPSEVAGWLMTEVMRDRPLRTSFTLLQGEPREGDES